MFFGTPLMHWLDLLECVINYLCRSVQTGDDSGNFLKTDDDSYVNSYLIQT